MLEVSVGVRKSLTKGFSLVFRVIKIVCAWAHLIDADHDAPMEGSPLLIHPCLPELVMFSERSPEGEVLIS